ncbi:MAG: ATP-binding protein, partial [Planctomycetota bacterium]
DGSAHRMTVRLVRDPQALDRLLVEVVDTGVGIDPALIDGRGRFRFGVTTRPRGHGVGLGVCRQIAEDLGGQLSIRSNVDRGARFSLTIPLPAVNSSAAFGPDTEPRRAG